MLDSSWKRWVAENKLLNISDQEIVDILKKHGFAEKDAFEELRNVKDHPYFQAANSYTQLLHKRHSLALIQRELYKLDPKHNKIERRNNVSREEFLEKYYAANRPVILCDQMHNWTAMTRWTPEYLKATCGDAMVNISAERNKNPDYETQDTKQRRSIKFSEFIDMVSSATETNDYYMTARDEFFKNPIAKPLFDDMEMFPNYLDPDSFYFFMWYGPKGTYTPLHHDPMNIFMAQVKGRKRIRLIPSTEMDIVYNDYAVYTPIDFRNPDYDKYPKFREASIIELILEPGEVLFLPVGWWHEVLALDISITISLMNFVFPNDYRWFNPTRLRVSENKEEAKKEESGIGQEWLAWIEDNINRGCDPIGIVEILEKNNFSQHSIKLAMGNNFPEAALKAAAVEEGPPIDYKALSEIPVAQLEWAPGFKQIETTKLQLFTLDNFLSEQECDEMINIINTNLRPSTVTKYIEGYRTSYTSDLCHIKNPLIDEIDKKIASALGIRVSYSEGMQAQKYDVGQEFKAHTDFFEPNTDEYIMHAGKRGNRTWTFMVYLNDTPKGGGTTFVNIDKTFYPKKGSAVIWNSLYPDGTPNRDTLHWGMPVEEGQKYIITKWFRERGTGPMFYNDAANS